MGIFAVIVAVGFILAITLKRKFDYDGNGEPHGYYEITRNGTYPLRGNLATYELIDEDLLTLISKEVPEYENFDEILKQMRAEGNLHLYTMKITDDSDIIDKIAQRSRILCAYPLESQEIFWTSQKGKLTLTSLIRKEKTRYAYAIKSKKITIINEDRNEDDWYILVPFPREMTKETVGFGNIKQLETTVYLKEISNASALVPRVNFSTFVADAVAKNETLIEEVETLKKFLKERTEDLKVANQKIQKKDFHLGQKKYVDIGKTEVKKAGESDLAFMLGGMIVVFIMMLIMPSFLPDVPNSQIIGFGIAMGIMGVVWKIQRDKKPQVEEEYEY